VRTLSPGELIGEPDALGGLTGGEVAGSVKKSVVRRFAFPPQEHRFSPGDTAYDHATGRGWAVRAIDDARGLIQLKVGSGYDGPLPTALVAGGPFDTRTHRDRLRELGSRVIRDEVNGRDAATALLLRLGPARGAAPGTPLRREGETAAEAPSGSPRRSAIRTCPSRDRREQERRTPRPNKSSSSPRAAAPSASPVPRTRSSTT
jgi:hypothetical protein